jgi:hypothetical protein
MTHNQTPLNDIWGRWPTKKLGPKPGDAIDNLVRSKGLQGLDALKAMMMLRPNGASEAQLDAACKAYGFDGWQGRNCKEADNEPDDEDDEIEYQCLIIGPDGNGFYGTLVATCVDHAFEEASYEFDGECVAVRRMP